VASILLKEAGFGPPGTRIIPYHQLQEAECVLISRSDQLSTDEILAASEHVRNEVPDAQVIPYSSVEGTNVPAIADIMISSRMSSKKAVAVDPALFAVEKASLGWYNATAVISHEEGLDAYSFAMSIMKDLAARFESEDIGHVKIVLSSTTGAMKTSLIRESLRVDGIRGGRYMEGQTTLVLNARIVASPKKLKETFASVIALAVENVQARIDKFDEACFSRKPQPPRHLIGDQ